jgi:hypothetical protein
LVQEQLIIDPSNANGDIFLRAFQRSSKTRPLHLSDLVCFCCVCFFYIMYCDIFFIIVLYMYKTVLFLQLYFPTFYDDHWFVFVVDIKDSKFAFLDSYYKKDDEFHTYIRDLMVRVFIVSSFCHCHIFYVVYLYNIIFLSSSHPLFTGGTSLQITQRHLMSLSCSILECHNSPIPMCMLSFIILLLSLCNV